MPSLQKKPARAVRSKKNRRRDNRTEYHTVVTIVATGESGLKTYKAWLVDISAGGALLRCPGGVRYRKLYLQILLPKLAQRFVEADVVNARADTGLKIARRQPDRNLIGVRFAGYVADPDLLEDLHAAVAHSRS
jgi:c-di-GMP-binding flagellar brake protein YcgR